MFRVRISAFSKPIAQYLSSYRFGENRNIYSENNVILWFSYFAILPYLIYRIFSRENYV